MLTNTEMKFMQAIAGINDARKVILAFLRRELDVNVLGFFQSGQVATEYSDLVLEVKVGR